MAIRLTGSPGEAGGAGAGRVVFSSDIQATAVVNATAADLALPDVVVPASPIPTGTSIQRVLLAVSWRKSVESSSLANAINVAQMLQVRTDTPGTWTDAVDMVDNALAHDADATEAGFMIVGDKDLSSIVTGVDTYNVQWEAADVDGASITFHDVQCHLIVEYA